MNYKKDWQYFEKNIKGKDYVCGDVHGYFNILQNKLNKVNLNPEIDRVFLLGDLIDRGPLSHQVLEWLDKPWIFSIQGNHELMAIEYFKSHGKEWNNWEVHGGKWFMDLPRTEQEIFITRFLQLPLVFEIETINGLIGMVHAECNPDNWLDFKFKFDKHRNNAQWGMNRYYRLNNKTSDIIKNIDYVIYGHNNVPYPIKDGNQFFIDTGARMKDLTLLEINNPTGIIAH